MKVVAAYLLAVLGGKSEPTAKDIKKILGSVGAEADDEKIDLLLKELDGKDLDEVIANGKGKFASFGGGGGGGGAVSGGGGGGGGGAGEAAEEEKEEEKKEEEEEEDEDMGFSLFD